MFPPLKFSFDTWKLVCHLLVFELHILLIKYSFVVDWAICGLLVDLYAE